MKKIIISMLTFLLMITGICLINVDASTVLAKENNTKFVAELLNPEEGQIPSYENYIFAGWYKDEACTEPYYATPSEDAWAKFVPEKVLSVKLQLTKDTHEGSPTTNMRLVTSVDSLDYRKVGFKVYFNGATNAVDTGSTKVFERIVASAESGVDYNHSPKVVDVESEYFVTATLINIANKNFDKNFFIKPYWITLDGTEVYGENRCVTIEDGCDTTIINIPIKTASTPGENLTVSGITNATAGLAYYDGTYAHIRIQLPQNNDRTSLVSATRIEVQDSDGIIGSAIYRNLLTTHKSGNYSAPNADTSWYEVYKDDTSIDSYVIATSADLYGFATIVNGTAKDGGGESMQSNFTDKKVYIVTDLEMNEGYANKETLTWDTTLDSGSKTTYAWTRIGKSDSSGRFAGTFDGQMHTISGIYMEASANKSGLFAEIGGNAVLKDFKLTNSYFNMNGKTYAGSIVGYVHNGRLDSIYSDALVLDGMKGVGGLCGSVDNGAESFIMNNCWYDGAVTASDNWFGGLVGSIGTSGSAAAGEITNCLNTGLVKGTSATSRNVGGLFGYSYAASNALVIKNSMNAGVINNTASNTDNQAKYFLIGNTGKALDCSNLYAIYNDSASVQTALPSSYAAINDVPNCISYCNDATDGLSIAGTKALTENTKALFTYVTNTDTYSNESYWAIVPSGAPVLSAFAKDAKVNQYQAIDTSWYNKDNSKFILEDAADFYGFALLSRDSNIGGFSGKTVTLGSDIAMNEGIVYSAKYDTGVAEGVTPIEWLPIGTNTYRFKGDFDGQGHNISGVYLNATEVNSGLFGYSNDTGHSVTIQDFSLTNSYFNSTYTDCGSIVGRAAGGKFDSIYSDAIVKSTEAQVGGMIGRVQGALDFVMNNCWFNGTVTNSGGTNCIGGLVGYIKTAANSREITNCLNSRDVIAISSSTKHVGGLIGWSDCTNLTISDSLNVGTITYNPEVSEDNFATYGLIGGTLGSKTTYESVYTTSQSGVSYAQGSSNADYTLDATLIYGTGAMEKMPTFYDLVTVDNKHKVYWAVTETTPILGDFIEFADEEVEVVACDTSWYDGSKNYTLYDASDLYGFAKLSEVKGFSEETVELGADITIPNDGKAVDWAENAPLFNWSGIGIENCTFNGSFNGNAHTISGIYKTSNTKYSGLFNHTGKSAVIQDFSLTNSYFTSTAACLGSVAGLGRGRYEKIYSDAIVVGEKESIGGLIGYAFTSATTNTGTVVDMRNCWFDGSVTNNGNSTSDRYTGGLIGRIGCHTELSNCLNTGKVSVPNYVAVNSDGTTIRPYAGGLVGLLASNSTLTINYCLNTGKVTYNEAATHAYGAIVGGANSGAIKGGTGVYATTSSCSSYSYVTSGATSELTILDNHVIDSIMLGEMATSTALFEKANAGVWMTVENETPILSYFEAWKGDSTSPEVTENSLITAINDAQKNSSYLTAAVSSPITLSDDATKDAIARRQGGCYVEKEDGTYYYQAFLQEYNDEYPDKSAVVIVKYDLSTNKEVMRSQTFAGDGYRMFHANDLTYNSKLDLLVVACGDGNSSKVVFINPDDLTWVGHKVLDCGIFALDYNATYDCYIVQTGTNDAGEGHYSYVLNGDMEIIAKYEDTIEVTKGEKTLKVHCDPRQTTGAGQGAACDDNYMYYLFSGDGIHSITVFDWTGNYVTEIQFTSSHEPESITVVDGTIYFNVLNSSEVYTLGSFSVK